MENIIENTDEGVAKEAVQIATLVWAMLNNEDSRVHVHVLARGDSL
ncbi:MAG: hypothetical protein AB1485_06050 [Candidatus Thermoplasmatota archaeon]